MTFTGSRSTTNYNYFTNGLTLLRSTGPIKDLGVLFDPKLKFDCHIHMIINKSHQLLGFINHSCTDFTDKLALKSIYCSLIRSICEYGSIVWFLSQTGKKQDWKKYNTNSYATSHLNTSYLKNLTQLTIRFFLY
jgi:hypothetical protein